MEEKRKGMRFHVPLQVEFMPSNLSSKYVVGNVRDLSPEGFSFSSKHFDLGPNETMIMRLKLLPQSDYVSFTGEIVWKKQDKDGYLVGIKVKALDQGTDTDNLGYPFDLWVSNLKT